MTNFYYGHFETEIGDLLLGRTDQGLCLVDTSTIEEIDHWPWFNKHFGEADLVEDPKSLQEAFEQIEDYLAGNRQEFDLTLDLLGTPFQQSVWRVLQSIPYGESMTYGDVAKMIGKRPNVAMAVGQAVGQNPIMIIVPCHRVLGQNQELTGYRGGIDMKAELLDIEGIDYQ